jgi:hypothetical protein
MLYQPRLFSSLNLKAMSPAPQAVFNQVPPHYGCILLGFLPACKLVLTFIFATPFCYFSPRLTRHAVVDLDKLWYQSIQYT